MFLRLLFLLIGLGLAGGSLAASQVCGGNTAKASCGGCCEPSGSGCCSSLPDAPQKLPPATASSQSPWKVTFAPVAFAVIAPLPLPRSAYSSEAICIEDPPVADVLARSCVWLI